MPNDARAFIDNIAGGAKEYQISDHLGSRRATLDGTGAVLGTSDYEPFGEPLAVTGESSRKGFIDREADGETGMNNFGVRQYDPKAGRFFGCDALWETYRALTPYQYGLQNPMLCTDPTGLVVDVTPLDSAGAIDGEDYSLALITHLRIVTGLVLYNDGGKIKYRKNADGIIVVPGGSETARNLLIKMIDSPELLNVWRSRLGNRGDGGGIWLKPDHIEGMMKQMNGVAAATEGWAMTFFHEYFHTSVGGSFVHDLETVGRNVDLPDIIGNKIRAELGVEWGQRYWYGFQVMSDGNGYSPYTPQALYDINDNQIPASGFRRIPDPK